MCVYKSVCVRPCVYYCMYARGHLPIFLLLRRTLLVHVVVVSPFSFADLLVRRYLGNNEALAVIFSERENVAGAARFRLAPLFLFSNICERVYIYKGRVCVCVLVPLMLLNM